MLALQINEMWNQPRCSFAKAIPSIKAQQISYKRQTCQTRPRRHVPELVQLNQLIENQQEHDGKENISQSQIFW